LLASKKKGSLLALEYAGKNKTGLGDALRREEERDKKFDTLGDL
jgi:hypothetical protein